MTTMTLDVLVGDACIDCPLHWYNDDGITCGADSYETSKARVRHDPEAPAPEWCPLQNGDVIVRLVSRKVA